MTLGRLTQSDRWSLIAAAFHLLLLIPSFALWVDWTFSAIPTARAAEEYPGQVDPKWRAARVNHGIVTEWRLGTFRQEPVLYAACSAVFAFSLFGFLYSLQRAKRASREGFGRA
jgi:hypothetical protein